MKKLMLLSVLAFLSANVFADPLAYDFKATIKHTYLKKAVKKSVGNFYEKYTKSSSLKGYLILDLDGVTSRRINERSTAQCLDLGRHRGFLVVMNKSAEKEFRAPKCLPVILDAKYYDSRMTGAVEKGPAQGHLFIGGDSVAAVRPIINKLNDGKKVAGQTLSLPAAGQPGGVAYADYAWQSAYLFGKFSGPYPEKSFCGFERDWNQNLPEALRRDGNVEDDGGFISAYHDLWMRGSGFGKCNFPKAKGGSFGAPVLDSLSGNFDGGIFLCTENGTVIHDDKDGLSFDPHSLLLENQVVTRRLVADGKPTGEKQTWDSDGWQDDVWLGGAVDQATTDVGYGTWSIKLNSKFFTANGVYGQYNTNTLNVVKELLNPQLVAGSDHPETVKGGDMLLRAILAAACGLDKKAKNLANGRDVCPAMDKKIDDPSGLPMLTPKFCTYYGLNNFQ